MTVPPELKSLYKEGRVIPFVGAGASMSFTWDLSGNQVGGPSWSDMVDEAAKLLGADPQLLRVRGTDIQILEYFKLKHANLDKLKNWLVRKLNPDDDAIRKSEIHTALSKLEKCRLFYTTNYDDFVERALKLAGRRVQAVAKVEHMASDAECEVIKFHGDLNNMNEMVMTESDYESRLQLDTALDYRLRSDALNRALLFIGYSFRDSNVAYLFRRLNDAFKALPSLGSGSRGYIVFEDPSDFELRLFKQRNIEVISIDKLNRTSDTAAVLEEMIK